MMTPEEPSNEIVGQQSNYSIGEATTHLIVAAQEAIEETRQLLEGLAQQAAQRGRRSE